MARFVSERLAEPLDPAFARATGACAVFLVVLLIGYRLGPGRRIAAALSALRGPDRRINVGAAVAGALIVGISAQALIVVRGDGPAAAFEYASEQTTLSESFALFLLAGFATAGVLVWAAWRRPRGRLQWAAFISVVVAVCLFSVAAGSRGRVFVAVLALAVIVHYLWRPWRRREVAVAALLFVLFASSSWPFARWPTRARSAQRPRRRRSTCSTRGSC